MIKAEFMYVDGIPVVINGEKNMLQLIRKTGVKLPTFCYHTDLSIYGACRMCMVEDEKGNLYTACSTPPKSGMSIKTNTARLRKYRENILELLLANHCRDCTTCVNNKACKLQDLAVRFNIDGVRFPNSSEERRVTNSNSCITFDSGKCILCGDCVRTCSEVQNVGAIDFAYRGSKMVISTAFGKPLSESPCVGCGQCAVACPTGAIMPRSDIKRVWDAIADQKVKTVVQVAPAVRVAMGNMEGVKEGKNLPIITSCCPGWVQYCEKKHPGLLKNVSTCRSPMQMFASVIKEEREEKGKKLFHVAIMPCTAKKFEAERKEFMKNGIPNVDAVITSEEFTHMLREAGIMLSDLDPEPVDAPYDRKSGAGVIFGVTGGVTEAVLRNVVEEKSRSAVTKISQIGVRGNEGIKEFEVGNDESVVKVAVVSGLMNAEKVLRRVENGEKFDIIEVMACPGGCVSGGGQPFVHAEVRQKRGGGLYEADRLLSIRHSEENPAVKACYDRLLRGREHQLLHVEY